VTDGNNEDPYFIIRSCGSLFSTLMETEIAISELSLNAENFEQNRDCATREEHAMDLEKAARTD
jgi:hypothetical protein